MTRYQVDGIFINRWAGSGMCYCEHCRANFQAATGHRPAAHGRPAGSARGAPTSSGSRSASSSSGGSGTRRSAKINPDSCVIPNAGGGATSPLDMKTIGELAPTLFADRQARSGLMRPVGQRQERARSTAPRWAASRSAASSAWASRRRTAGRTRCRASRRSASGSPTGSPTACGPGSPSSPARSTTAAGCSVVEDLYRWHHRQRAVPAQRGAAGPGGAGLLAADRLVLRRRARAAEGRGPRAGLVPGADRGPHPVRDGARPAARRGAPGAVQDADPAEHRRALGRAVPAAPRVRRARRRPRGDVRDVALRRVGRAAHGLRPGRPVRRLVPTAAPTGRCRTPTCGSRPIPARASGTRCSPAWTTPTASSTASRACSTHAQGRAFRTRR